MSKLIDYLKRYDALRDELKKINEELFYYKRQIESRSEDIENMTATLETQKKAVEVYTLNIHALQKQKDEVLKKMNDIENGSVIEIHSM